MVHDVSTLPVLGEELMDLDEGTTGKATSESISRAARQAFVKAEGGSVQHADANRTSGTASFDGLGTVLWVHEYVLLFEHLLVHRRIDIKSSRVCRPNDFSYKQDSRHNSYVVAASLLLDSDTNDGFLKTLRNIVNGPRRGRSKLSKLRLSDSLRFFSA